MRNPLAKSFCLLLAALVALSGCFPTQPFYLRDDGDMSYYLDQAMQREYPDLARDALPDARFAEPPHTLTDPEFREMWDLSLEECVAIALHNTKTIRGSQSPILQGGAVISAGNDTITAGNQLSAIASIYNPAVQASEPGQFLGATAIRNTVADVDTPQLSSTQGVEGALADFDAQLTSSVFWTQTDRPQNVMVGSPVFGAFFNRALVERRSPFAAELSKRTAYGTHFFFRNTTDYVRSNQRSRNVSSDWTTAFEMEARHPLLRGHGPQVNRAPVVIARIAEDERIADLEQSLHNMLANIEIRYWDLHLAYRVLEARKEGRDAALVTWKIAKTQQAEGAITSQQEAQAREQYFFFRSQVEQALTTLYAAETDLRFLMGLAASDSRLIRPIDDATTARVTFAWCEILEESLFRRPIIREEKWVLKRREMEMILARNRLLPVLNVTALYRWLGVGDQLISANRNGVNFPLPGSTAFEGLTDGDFQEANVGLTFEMPVGFRRELAAVRNAQIKIARERANLDDLELSVSRELTQAARALDGNYHLAESHYNRWVATTTELEVFKDQIDAGFQTLDVLLDAQRRNAQAQEAYYDALVNYNKAIALVHLRKGSIAEYSNVLLDEGPWPEKAYWDAMGHARRRSASTQLNYGFTRPGVISQGPAMDEFGLFGTPPQSTTDGAPRAWTGEEIMTPQPTPAAGGPEMNGGTPYFEGEPLPAPRPGDNSAAPSGAPVGTGLRIGAATGDEASPPLRSASLPAPAAAGMMASPFHSVTVEQAVQPVKDGGGSTPIFGPPPIEESPVRRVGHFPPLRDE